MNAYQRLLQEAERNRSKQGLAKEQAYVRLKRQLEAVQLPVSYEQAVKQLCDKLGY